jgi:nicotinate-nucleotide--dimethylbenzimidazole phosphoribosyltransferase
MGMDDFAPDDDLRLDECVSRFAEPARRAVYEAMSLRRDVRHFQRDRDVDDETLTRVLAAAHLAPSVGFSQPWRFVVIRERARRARIRESFLRCRAAEADRFPPERRARYLAHRLEGILEAGVNLCVAVDLRSRGEAILGTTVQPEAVRASVCCAVQNFWLAARVEGIGVGWVSIVEPAVLRAELRLPAGVDPVAYLCVGHPVAFRSRPMLQETGWLERRRLEDLVHREHWSEAPEPGSELGTDDRSAPAVVTGQSHTASLAQQRELTKPLGSLGRLENLAAWYAAAVGAFPCEPPENAALVVFAADHGVVVEGVSAYSSQVTADMVCNIMAGGAAVNVLARRYRVKLALIDVGVAGDLSAAPVNPEVFLVSAKVAPGTRNLRREPAMTRAQAMAAMDVGIHQAEALASRGVALAAAGEVGIGNTTAAAALICAISGASPEEVTGSGTGVDEETRARKVRVVVDALGRAGGCSDAIDLLASFGGLELAAIVGFYLRCAERGVPVVLDGFLSSAAALVARSLRSNACRYFVASHASAERGSPVALRALGLEPILSLGMRLGEGTGAILGIELVRTAVTLQKQMATFATLGARKDAAGGIP